MSETLKGAPFECVVCEYELPGNVIIILTDFGEIKMKLAFLLL